MGEIDLITSHAPWSRTPRMIDQAAVGDGSVYDGMPEQLPSERDIWPSPTRVKKAYGDSIEYSLKALTTFLTTYADDNTVVVFLGDHQPAPIVSGNNASHDVPVAIVAHDPKVIHRISGWGWDSRDPPQPGGAGVADGRVPRPVPHRLRLGQVGRHPGSEQSLRPTRPAQSVSTRSATRANLRTRPSASQSLQSR